MCGIAAFVPSAQASFPAADAMSAVQRMVDTLQYRGPDERHVEEVGGATFGHARLSIIDLCTGSQPMFNEDGSVAVILNGEIYNYRELRAGLEANGHVFHSTSDTEVIAHLYEDFGDQLFTRLNGMFAIAIWDRTRRRLVAGRDRLGEKPLLYHEGRHGLVLASEVKAVLEFPGVPRDVDEASLALYFTSMYVPAPRSIFRSIRKLLPGHFLTFDGQRLDIQRYWQLSNDVDRTAKEGDLVDEFKSLFADAVKMRMVADVPLGVFLSGGIDSSAVGAYMALAHSGPVRTFTVGFADEVDERPYARLVAERYRTVHQELLVEARLEDEFEKIFGYLDEPFGDSSVVPTHVISRAAREHVKVILTGDGGDELFAGYPMYVDQKYRIGGRPRSVLTRRANALAMRIAGTDWVSRMHNGHSARAFASWHDTRSIFRGGELREAMKQPPALDPARMFSERLAEHGGGADSLTTAFLYDLEFYLPDDLLKKVDMASMRASIECRAPFLDHRLVEWAMRLPPGFKLRGDVTKAFLKQALSDVLPEPILTRAKQGFGAPVSTWLTRQLKTLMLDLTSKGCRAEAWLHRSTLDAAREAALGGKLEGDYRQAARLWLIVVFEMWLRTYGGTRA
jgi:asparagine synthase (glutamine-hydrolysing)